MKLLLALALLLGLAAPTLADSPLTSTNLHEAYGSELARILGKDTSPAAHVRALLGKHPREIQAALVSHLGWTFEGQGNAGAYLDALARRKEVAAELLAFEQLDAGELFVFGYLRAMDDYLELKPIKPGAAGPRGESPGQLLTRAAALAPEDFTIHFVLSLVRAQDAMASSFCAVWQNVSACLKAFPEGKRNMRPEAVAQVMSYVGDYEKDCLAVNPAANAEMDQVYRLVPYRKFVVAGTQAGTVFWDAATRTVHSRFADRIVTDVVVHEGKLWTASQAGVRVYDGTAWKSVLEMPSDNPGCSLLATRTQGLYAFQGSTFWRCAPGRREFAKSTSPLGAVMPYHALQRADGQLWAVEFGRAVWHGGKRIAAGTPEYPGRDPRRLFEDSRNVLRVADFAKGFFRLDDASGKLVPEESAGEKASAVAVDAPRSRTYYLNYVDRMLVRETGKPDRTVELPELEYMRDLHVADNGDVWVAGWTGIAVLDAVTGRQTTLRSARK